MSLFRRTVDNLKIALILLHHPPKADDTIRGHGSINAALDLALHAKRETFSDIITITATKTRHAFIKPFGAQFSYTHKPGTSELETARFWGCKNEDMTEEFTIKTSLMEVLENWQNESYGRGQKRTPPCKTQIIESVTAVLQNVGINRIRAAIDDLVKEKQWIQVDGPRNSKRYELPK